MIYQIVRNKNVEGLPKEITLSALNSFSHKYGTTPDVIQLATPNLDGNTKGYFSPKAVLSNVQLLRHSKTKQLPSTRSFWQRGLYVGLLIDVPGAYRITVNTRNKIKSQRSSKESMRDLNLYQLTDNTNNTIKLFQLPTSVDHELAEVRGVKDSGNSNNSKDNSKPTTESNDDSTSIDDQLQIQKVPDDNITDDYIYHETVQPTTGKTEISIYERDKLKNQQQYQS
jgi:hypothetical protein